MADKGNLSLIEAFIRRYAEKEANMVRKKIDRDQRICGHMFDTLASIERLGLALRKKTAPSYNLFEVLNIRHLETRVHTPFLANLLSPNGSHHQGDLFYRLFIKRLFPYVKIRQKFKAGPFLRIIEEQYVSDYGRIDIVIRNYDPDNPFALIVENKIYAGDQLNQLERYYNIGKSRFRLKDEQLKIYYLTLDKSEPSHKSIDNETLIDLKAKDVLHLLGYWTDIVAWLQECLPLVQSDNVKIVIEQYLKTIQSLAK